MIGVWNGPIHKVPKKLTLDRYDHTVIATVKTTMALLTHVHSNENSMRWKV